MRRNLPLLGSGTLIALFLVTQVSCIPTPLDFNGTYLFTLAYEDGFQGEGYVSIAQEGQYVEVDMELPHLDQLLSGAGTVIQGDTIFFQVVDTLVPDRAPEPTSLTFNGRGIDLNGDGMVESLVGSFAGTECTDTCDEVIGDFDGEPEETTP